MPGVPQNIDPAQIDLLKHSLVRFHLMQTEWDRLARIPAEDGSPTWDDLTDRSLRHAHDQANAHLVASLDHLGCVAIVVESRSLPPFAIMSLARVALETALVSHWMLEPDSRDGRRARGFAALWRDLDERRKVEDLAGLDEAKRKQTELLDQAEAHGLVTLHPDGRRRLTNPMPSAVALVRRWPPPDGIEWLYRYLSGYSHGKSWALLAGIQTETAIPLDQDIFAAVVATPDEHLVEAVRAAVDAVALAIGRIGRLRQAPMA
jgi:hypothetical protein